MKSDEHSAYTFLYGLLHSFLLTWTNLRHWTGHWLYPSMTVVMTMKMWQCSGS